MPRNCAHIKSRAHIDSARVRAARILTHVCGMCALNLPSPGSPARQGKLDDDRRLPENDSRIGWFEALCVMRPPPPNRLRMRGEKSGQNQLLLTRIVFRNRVMIRTFLAERVGPALPSGRHLRNSSSSDESGRVASRRGTPEGWWVDGWMGGLVIVLASSFLHDRSMAYKSRIYLLHAFL